MNRTRRIRHALPAGFILLAGIACLAAGCDEARDRHLREERIASALPLAPQTALRIETRTADVHLVPSPDDTIRVVTVKRIQSMSERSVDALWNQLKVTVERSGDELVLRVREPERGTGHVSVQAGPWRVRRRIEIEITVAVPSGRPVSFTTERGDIDARDLKQDLALDMSGGDATVSDLEGGSLRVQSTSGDVSVERVRQPVTVRTTSGDVDVSDLVGTLAVRATSGDVTIHRARGRIAVETSSGDADLVDGDGNLLISTSSGDVSVRARADSLVVETSSGDQDLLLSAPAGLVSLKSSSGTIEIGLVKGSGGALDVQTATGAMKIANAVQIGSMTRNHFTGNLGGTGRTQVRSSSGNIRISSLEPPSAAAVEGGAR
ncbi:MAG: DUF4097 family beta strand repeat-containing protein [Candidatus Eisenbacteria bacterium]